MYGIINVGTERYQVKRTSGMSLSPMVSEWNSISPAYLTLSDGNQLYFCELIEDAIVVEEEIKTEIQHVRKPRKRKTEGAS